MENKTSKYITQINRVLNSERLLKRQRETLEAFDRYIELETNCSLGTRKGYLDTLHELGVKIPKPFEEMSKEDLQTYIHAESNHHKEGRIALYKQHIKRFFKYLEWVKVNKGKPDEEKIDINDVKVPYSVRWIKLGMVESEITLEDLPIEEEVKRIASCVDRQRDRALVLQGMDDLQGSEPTEEELKRLRERIKPTDLDAFLTLVQLSPKIKQLYKRLWESVAAEHLKLQTPTPNAKVEG